METTRCDGLFLSNKLTEYKFIFFNENEYQERENNIYCSVIRETGTLKIISICSPKL